MLLVHNKWMDSADCRQCMRDFFTHIHWDAVSL